MTQTRRRREAIYLDYVKLKDIIPTLQDLAIRYGEDALVEIDTDDGSSTVYVSYSSPETEKEREQREAAELSMKAYRQKQFEQLKKEFGE